jgi:hypothetical protein
MTEVLPAPTPDPARWLLRSDVDWWDLVRYGPPGFDVYVRVRLVDAGVAPDDDVDAVRAALTTLASCTATPDVGYAAIWEGWGGSPNPLAPLVAIPNRRMLLFTGPIATLRDAPSLAWYGSATAVLQQPHLVWPEDQAWCLACEVDEDIEFTVGCTEPASHALARALPAAVRRVSYGQPAPLYRDQAED